MEVLEFNEENKKEIKNLIKRYGWTVEHKYVFFKNQQTNYKRNQFIRFDNDGGFVVQRTKSGIFYTVSEVMAPRKRRNDLYYEFLDYAFKKGSKVWTELRTQSKNELLNDPRWKNYRDTGNMFSLNWPVFDLKNWDGNRLKGKGWKKLRNKINSVMKRYKVTFGEPSDFSRKQLIEIVQRWKQFRNAEETIDTQQYINIIKSDFEDYDHVRVIALDGKPCAITGGWNTNNKNEYYSNFGLLNYRCSGLGELANWDDLVCLKKKGHRYVDFGGSDKALYRFKKKFKPYKVYQTHFSYIHKC